MADRARRIEPFDAGAGGACLVAFFSFFPDTGSNRLVCRRSPPALRFGFCDGPAFCAGCAIMRSSNRAPAGAPRSDQRRIVFNPFRNFVGNRSLTDVRHGGVIRGRHRETGSGLHRFLHSRAGERSKGALGILIEIGFQLGWTAVLGAVPKCQLQGDFIVGRQFRHRP